MLNLNFQNGQAPALNARNMNAIVESINTLGYAVGGPNVANTVSEMTDTSKVYVYTGSETGYTAGNWYYYNGSAWVSGGVYQATAVETDTTLTMPGEPADAKATGDAVTDLKNALPVLTGGTVEDAWEPGYFDLSDGVTTIDINDRTSHANWVSVAVPCVDDDVFYVTATGAFSARAVAFIDTNGVILSRTSGDASALVVTNKKFTAPETAGYILVNSKKAEDHLVIKGGDVPTLLTGLNELSETTELLSGCEIITWNDGYYIDLSGDTANVNQPVSNDGWSYAVVSCSPGENYSVHGYGRDLGRLWAFLDSDGNILTKATVNEISDAFRVITAPNNAATLVLNSKNDPDQGVAVRGVAPTEINGSRKMSENEFMYGALRANGLYIASQTFMVTKDFIGENVKGFVVTSNEVKVAVGIWDGISFSRYYWVNSTDAISRFGYHYTFDHSKKYKLYIGYTDERKIYDVDEIVKSITLYQDEYTAAFNGYAEENSASVASSLTLAAERIKNVMRKNYDISFANASTPFTLMSSYGDNQNVHPKVLYVFGDGFAGHRWWMAYTPYPWGDASKENPCIAFSDDGINWTNIPGNPIDVPVVGYFSDTHLVYREDTGVMECWYRQVDTARTREVIYRKTSTDGVNWSARETLFSTEDGENISHCLSPAVIYYNGLYHIWYVYYSYGSAPSANYQYIKYCTSVDGTNWTFVRDIKLSYVDSGLVYRLWHLDLIKDDNNYVLLAMCKGGPASYDGTDDQKWSLFLSTSADNETYTTPTVVMYGANSWDKYLYRSSIVHAGTYGYLIYYSGLDEMKKYGMARSTSDSLAKFVGDII